jgi:hypothetical protein
MALLGDLVTVVQFAVLVKNQVDQAELNVRAAPAPPAAMHAATATRRGNTRTRTHTRPRAQPLLTRARAAASRRAPARAQERGRKDLGLRLESLVPLLTDLERLKQESRGEPPITAPLHPVQTLLKEARAHAAAPGRPAREGCEHLS